MTYTIFNRVYDSKSNSKAESYFQKVVKWLENMVNPEAIEQLKNIFRRNKYAQACLVEGVGASEMLLESVQEIKEAFGTSQKTEQAPSSTQEELKKVFGAKKEPANTSTQTEIKEAFA